MVAFFFSLVSFMKLFGMSLLFKFAENPSGNSYTVKKSGYSLSFSMSKKTRYSPVFDFGTFFLTTNRV